MKEFETSKRQTLNLFSAAPSERPSGPERKTRIYLDNAATTRVSQNAASAVYDAMTENFGNPSSSHKEGMTAQAQIRAAREKIAASIGAGAGEIFFTSGGTEANNWAVLSAAYKQHRRGRHIIATAAEHDSVLKPLEKLVREGFEVTYLRPGRNGDISPDAVKEALRDDTILVSVMLVNNETGNVYPVREISEIIKRAKRPPILHTDAVQGYLKLRFTAASLGADLISLSAHKIHGPKGIGALYIKKGLGLPAFILGGGQESELRSGTEAVPNIAGFATAASEGFGEMESNTEKLVNLKKLLLENLSAQIPEAVILASPDAPHIVTFSIKGYMSEVVLTALDGEGICVSKGSACKRGRRSHVLQAMGIANELIDSSLRVSFSRENTEDDIHAFIDALMTVKKRIIQNSARFTRRKD